MFSQLLAASYDLHKFYYDVAEMCARIQVKKNQIPDELGVDYSSAEDFQRKHDIFAQDAKTMGLQVRLEGVVRRGGAYVTKPSLRAERLT